MRIPAHELFLCDSVCRIRDLLDHIGACLIVLSYLDSGTRQGKADLFLEGAEVVSCGHSQIAGGYVEFICNGATTAKLRVGFYDLSRT